MGYHAVPYTRLKALNWLPVYSNGGIITRNFFGRTFFDRKNDNNDTKDLNDIMD
jgi:hypothetical protein